MTERHRRGFRAPARCRPEAGAPSRPPRSDATSSTRFALDFAPRDAGPHRENWPEVGVPSRPRASSRLTMCDLAALRAAVLASSPGGGREHRRSLASAPHRGGRRPRGPTLFPHLAASRRSRRRLLLSRCRAENHRPTRASAAPQFPMSSSTFTIAEPAPSGKSSSRAS